MGECDLTPGLQQATDFVCGCLCVFCFLISGDHFDKRAEVWEKTCTKPTKNVTGDS